MNTNIKHVLRVLSLSALLPAMTACSLDSPFEDNREGVLSISTDFRSDVKVTRALSSEDIEYLRGKCVVYIENSKGLIRKFIGADQIPEDIKLKVGSYVAEAWSGDSVSASYDKKFYRAYQRFEMNEGANTLNIRCNIANVVVSLDPESFTAGVTDLKVDFWHSRGELSFDSSNKEAKGYFMMPNADKDLQYRVSGKQADGTAFEKTGTIRNVERAHEYCLNVVAEERPITEGGALIRIVIADIPLIEDDIEIFMPPVVSGLDFDISKQVVSETRDFSDVTVKVKGYFGMNSILANYSSNFTGMTSGENILDSSVMTKLRNMGVNVEKTTRQEKTDEGTVNVDEVYVTFTKAYLDALAASDTEYTVEFDATDGQHKLGKGTLRIANSSSAVEHLAPIGTAPAPAKSASPMAILAHEANLQGYIYDAATAVNPAMMYREAGTTEWLKASPESTARIISRSRTRADISTFDVKLSGLKAGTTYEYKAVCDGYEDTDVMSFTTESVFAITNSSFEEWSSYSASTLLGTKNVVLPGSTGDKLTSFWGSGNEGAATANMTLTDKSTDMKGNGTYSVRLESKSAMGMLAAGNLFAGYYVKTDGTNGVLSVGREYNGTHPTALKVKVNYRPASGVKVKSGNESFVPEGFSGGTDHGQIYVALTTGAVEIRTNPSNRKVFNKDDQEVLAYGQVTWTANYGPDGALQDVVIPIEYFDRARSTSATHLVIVVSASKYGDYFSGASGSVMYLDDFELIYDK